MVHNRQLVLLSETPDICIPPFFSSVFYLFRRSGPFLLGCTGRLGRFGAFLPGQEGDEGGSARPLPSLRPVLGPSVHLGALRCRTTVNSPQVTEFRELRDFYGCPKVDLGAGISASRARSAAANVTGNAVMKHCAALRLRRGPPVHAKSFHPFYSI